MNPADPVIQPIIFGTMRMDEAAHSVEEWAQFFILMHGRGIRKLHSSSEYESFPLLCTVLETVREQAPDITFQHVVKLAEPSFDDVNFDKQRLQDKIETYRHALGASIIHDVQWMWRSSLDDEEKRLVDFALAENAIAGSFAALKQQGIVGRFLCFPYSIAFAASVIHRDLCDGLVIYRNDSERDFDPFLDQCDRLGKACLIIRPFLGGALLTAKHGPARAQLERALDHAAIEAGILSTSRQTHLDELLNEPAYAPNI